MKTKKLMIAGAVLADSLIAPLPAQAAQLVDVRIDSFNGGWGESTDLRVKDAVVTASDCRSFTTAEIKDVIKSGVAQTFACDNALRPDLESVTITPAGL
jgi:hypothetical protein